MTITGPRKVLVVDDEPEVLDSLLDYLGMRGYAVEGASSVSAAKLHLDRNDFDAAVLDVNLSGESGLTLLEDMHAGDQDLSVIIITGKPSADTAIKALRGNADDYLQKPFDLDALDHTLARALERRDLKRENQALVNRLDRLQSEFARTVSHELRTPVTDMKGALENLDTYCAGQLDADARAQLAICIHAITHLEERIELIMLAVEAGSVELSREEIEARDLAEEAVQNLRSFAAAKKIRIELDAPADPVPVCVDHQLFVKALGYVLSNAIKFSPPGETVRMEIEAAGETVRFHMIDRGSGIDPRNQGLIFRRFTQIDGSLTRGAGGTGLGLSVCRAIVERHGGRVLVMSNLGQGSRFTVEISAAAHEVRRAEAA